MDETTYVLQHCLKIVDVTVDSVLDSEKIILN